MIRKEIIKEIVADFREREITGIISRDIDIPFNSGKVITLIGVRRCGKTFLLLDNIIKLIKSGIAKERIFYLNFEDERLNLKSDELDLILQSFREMNPDIDLSNCYLFFDEIQNIEGCEKFIRRVYDSICKNIFLTGSNSKFLSSDIATSLRGRTITFEVFPLSFREYLHFRNIELNYNSSKNKSIINKAFIKYLNYGGFPEVINFDNTMRDKVLQEYYRVMLYKDIIERYNINNTQILNYFLGRILANLSKATSVNKIYNELKSANYKTSKNILYDILDWTESIYYTSKVMRFSYSLIGREQAERKFYIIDNGLVNALTFSFSDDYGKLLENLIAIHLRRNFGNNVYFYKESLECDFVTFLKDKPERLVQVCYNISEPDTLKREIAGLTAACKYFNLKSGIIVTAETESRIETEGISIDIMPAAKFLLGYYGQ
ncbi:MAG: uncharacterized protein QG635_198 [Bacteroidota bacterium]|nr:uncharacterized protein [Bacteroidota bacterium]